MEGRFESNGLNVNLGKTNEMVTGGIIEDGLSKSKVGPFVVCCMNVKRKVKLIQFLAYNVESGSTVGVPE